MCVSCSLSTPNSMPLKGYLFDRRKVGRFLQEEWGVVNGASGDDVAMCVRRFGRPSGTPVGLRNGNEHIFGARVSESNGHEVHLIIPLDLIGYGLTCEIGLTM